MFKKKRRCPIYDSKDITARKIIDLAVEEIKNNNKNKLNLIWLEATGCSGNIISLLNAENPSADYLFKEMTSLEYNNSLMSAEGDAAYEQFLNTLDTEFILAV